MGAVYHCQRPSCWGALWRYGAALTIDGERARQHGPRSRVAIYLPFAASQGRALRLDPSGCTRREACSAWISRAHGCTVGPRESIPQETIDADAHAPNQAANRSP